MSNKQKIPCFVLIYEQVDIIKKCLSFLIKYSDRLNIIIVENYSSNTQTIIKPYVIDLINNKLIWKYYLFEKNIYNVAIHISINHAIKTYLDPNEYPYVYVTDGDLTIEDSNWIDEQLSILDKCPNAFVCGCLLDYSNLPIETIPDSVGWIQKYTDRGDYNVGITGTVFNLYRTPVLIEAMKYLNDNGLKYLDYHLHHYHHEIKNMIWTCTKKAKSYHLTWDLYADPENPYTIYKLRNYKTMWFNNTEASYQLFEHDDINNQSDNQSNSELDNRPNIEPNGQSNSEPSNQPNNEPNYQSNSEPSNQPNSEPNDQSNSELDNQSINEPNTEPNTESNGQSNSELNNQSDNHPNNEPNSEPNNEPNNQFNKPDNEPDDKIILKVVSTGFGKGTEKSGLYFQDQFYPGTRGFNIYTITQNKSITFQNYDSSGKQCIGELVRYIKTFYDTDHEYLIVLVDDDATRSININFMNEVVELYDLNKMYMLRVRSSYYFVYNLKQKKLIDENASDFITVKNSYNRKDLDLLSETQTTTINPTTINPKTNNINNPTNYVNVDESIEINNLNDINGLELDGLKTVKIMSEDNSDLEFSENEIEEPIEPIKYHIVCRESIYHYFKDYVESFIDKLNSDQSNNPKEKSTANSIISNQIHIYNYIDSPNHVYIFCQCIDDHLFKKSFNKMVIFTEQLTKKQELNQISRYVNHKIPVIHYSIENMKINNNPTDIYIPYQYNKKEIKMLRNLYLNTPKEYDVAFCGSMSPRRRKIIDDIKSNGLKVLELVRGYWGNIRDCSIAKCKVLVNVHYSHDYNVYEPMRCDRWAFATMPIVSEDSIYDELLDVKKYGLVTFCPYDELVTKIIQTLKGANKHNLSAIKIIKHSRKKKFYQTLQHL
ncbi:hypothetical protein qu_146 [Acanthamoeba polyphaga mimivirus]|nr:hypothetical protein [Mimivirus reunion]WMV61484.1 hypothetical protein qu_146 [Mimivirus sp.]WMV62461.1 hypothetical protein qu_146 [Acanthamoeba polyphaga mimivirus]WMV63438.1 hypothetical protein qu_146 [Mimivirus sp.]